MSVLDSPAPTADKASQTSAHFSPEPDLTLSLYQDDTAIHEVFGNPVSETLTHNFVFDEQDPFLTHRLDKLASTLFQDDSVDKSTLDSTSSTDPRFQYLENETAELLESANEMSTEVTILLTATTEIIQPDLTTESVVSDLSVSALQRSGTELYLPNRHSRARPTMDPTIRETLSNVPSPSSSGPGIETENRSANEIYKPKFKRRNQIVLKGNNNVGRKGLLRCDACRKRHSKCRFKTSESQSCEHCTKHNIPCIMKWGPKTEETIQLAKNLPIASDAIVNDDDGWRLHYLRSAFIPTWNFGLFQKLVTVYGPTITCPPLRLAVLAWFCPGLPYRNERTDYIVRAMDALAKTRVYNLGEGELLAVAFLAISIRYHFILEGDSAVSGTQIPASSLQVRWFTAIMKRLMSNGMPTTGNDFGGSWLHIIFTIVLSAPFNLEGTAFWELLDVARPLLQPSSLNVCSEYFSHCMPVNPADLRPTDTWNNREAWAIIINLNLRIALIGLSTVLRHEINLDFDRDPLVLAGLHDAQEMSDSVEASRIHRDSSFDFLVTSPSDAVSAVDLTYEPMDRVRGFLVGRLHQVTRMLLGLLLDGQTLKEGLSSCQAVQHAPFVILDAQIILSLQGVDKYDQQLHILFVLIAALVHSVSKITEGTAPFLVGLRLAREIAIQLLRQWTAPDVSITVERYWSQPDMYFDAIREVVWQVFERTMSGIGESQ